jgi:hypothetical protein
MADIVADLRLLRERGLVRIRHAELTALRRAVSLSPGALAEGQDGSGPRAIEALLRAAVANLGGGQLAAAAEHTFGLNRGGRDRPAQDRRQRAAQEYGVSQEPGASTSSRTSGQRPMPSSTASAGPAPLRFPITSARGPILSTGEVPCPQ